MGLEEEVLSKAGYASAQDTGIGNALVQDVPILPLLHAGVDNDHTRSLSHDQGRKRVTEDLSWHTS